MCELRLELPTLLVRPLNLNVMALRFSAANHGSGDCAKPSRRGRGFDRDEDLSEELLVNGGELVAR